jgi:hypothetical protein
MTTPDDERSGAPRPRVARPDPERTMPRRSWSTLFAPFGGTDQEANSAGGAATENGSANAGPGETVARAVELGYRVIDEYIRQGQKAAQRLSTRTWSPETALRDTQDLTARMTRHASDLVGLWVDLLDTSNMTGAWRATAQSWTMDPSAPDAGSPAHGPSDHADDETRSMPGAAGTAPPGRTRIAIEIASERPAEVIVDLRSEDTTRKLVVHSLRAVEPEKPRITEVGIEPATPHAPARLRIRVPTEQPSGTYNALVIDEETSRPVGSVSVRISS